MNTVKKTFLSTQVKDPKECALAMYYEMAVESH